MISPTRALIWEIWRRNRLSFLLAAGLLVFAWIFNGTAPATFRATASARERLMALDWLLLVGSMLLVFASFNYTEFNPRKEWNGFPYRLFALPVPTWRLVALPALSGVATVALVYWAWMKLVFVHDEPPKAGWFGFLLGGFMIFFQATLWTLAGFRILRIVVLGFGGVCFVGIACLPFSGDVIPTVWSAERRLVPLLSGMALMAMVIAWTTVSRQRTGGGRRNHWIKAAAEQILDILPRRRAEFANPAAAQFWFEWRRSGLLLPAAIAALLLLVIGPLSWHARNDAEDTLWVLMWTLATPVILAAAMGKGFSKPDFWSGSLALPPFLAVRPISNGEMVVVKMKVAALSVLSSWTLVLVFLGLWLPLWADLDSLTMMRVGYWMVQGHSVMPQYLMAALFTALGMLVTWKFLAGGLWVGLSGNRKWFIGSVFFYYGVFVLGLIGLIELNILLKDDAAFRQWLHKDPDRLLSMMEWIVAAVVMAKFWAAGFWWHAVSLRRQFQYLLIWAGGAAVLILLAFMLWAGGLLSLVLSGMADLFPFDPLRLQHFLILLALAVVPLARVGLAPSSLAKNRQGAGAAKNNS